MYSYQNPYNPYGNQFLQNQPMIDRFNQFQQMAQNPNNFINGKIVDNFDMISANDVPLSGFATFIKNDFSEIEVRQWASNGTITKATFKPVNQPEQKQPTEFEQIKNLIESYSQRFDSIENTLNGLKPAANNQKRS